MAIIVNRLTKIKYFLLIKILKLSKLANWFIKKVYSLYKALETIILNKGTQFILTFWKTLSKKLGIILKPLTAFNL